MAVRKMIGLGSKLYIKTSTASTTTYTEIGGLINLPGPDGSGDAIDTSTIDNSDNFKTFQRGQVDPGDMTLTLAYSSTDTSSKKLGTYYKTGTMCTFKVDFPSTAVTDETFTGFVNGMGRAIEKDSMITRTVTVKCSGSPGFTST